MSHQTLSIDAKETLTTCWAKGMSVSSTFSLARTKGLHVTYQQVTAFFNSKNSAFETSFAAIFNS